MNNQNRKNATTGDIIQATIDLLKQADFDSITISQIVKTAKVSRNSFYRNFTSKEDILEQHIKRLLTNWQQDYDRQANQSNPALFGSLFQHLKEHSDFYLLLKERQIFHLFAKAYLTLNGARAEDENIVAYTKNFIAGGIIYWIEEWLARGMVESAESMTALLSAHGMS